MFRTEKREVIVIAAIAALILLVVVPATVAAATSFLAEDFQSGNLNKWTVSNHQEAA
jgi:hypothetical protein